jgi:hypothetical protein
VYCGVSVNSGSLALKLASLEVRSVSQIIDIKQGFVPIHDIVTDLKLKDALIKITIEVPSS